MLFVVKGKRGEICIIENISSHSSVYMLKTVLTEMTVLIATVGGSLCSARACVYVLIFVFQELFKMCNKPLNFRLNHQKNVAFSHLIYSISTNTCLVSFSRKKNTLSPFISVCVFTLNKVSRLIHSKPLNILHRHLQQKAQTKCLAYGLIPNNLFKFVRSNTQFNVILNPVQKELDRREAQYLLYRIQYYVKLSIIMFEHPTEYTIGVIIIHIFCTGFSIT